MQSKYGKRPLDDSGDGGGSESTSGGGGSGGGGSGIGGIGGIGGVGGVGGVGDGPPAAKIQCTTTTTTSSAATGSSGGPAKFSVEIVQQLEFTASASGATSVSVKTLTNTSVKSEVSIFSPSFIPPLLLFI